jgi:hypothetical protein
LTVQREIETEELVIIATSDGEIDIVCAIEITAVHAYPKIKTLIAVLAGEIICAIPGESVAIADMVCGISFF